MDLQHARAEANAMLQSHGINPGKELTNEEQKESQASMPG